MLLIFATGYISIFLLTLQSRNVNHGNYFSAAIVAYLIGFSQALLWSKLISHFTPAGAVVYSTAGALGVVSAMAFHKRFLYNEP